jgi:DNA-binding NarL/FixJ family response regulator
MTRREGEGEMERRADAERGREGDGERRGEARSPLPVSPSPRVSESPALPLSASPSLRILLVDDHSLMVEGLTNLLTAHGIEVVGAARDGLEALELARSLRPDLILMDIRMPRCDGLSATRLIQAEMPEIQIVMLTTSAEESDLFEAIKSGASGYLLKNLEPNELFDYLSGLAQGEAPLSRELSARVLREFARQANELEQRDADPSETSPPPELTPREYEVLTLVADGLMYKEVAAALHLSEHTIKYHMGQVLQRLHLKNREQVVAYAIRSGLLRGDAGAQ